MQKRVALITGASGGIGADIARVLAKSGYHLVLVARRRNALEGLARELAFTPVLVIAVDLAQAGAAAEIRAQVAASGLKIDLLVNNAGFGLLGSAARLDRDEQLEMIDVNIRALTDLTLTFLPDLIEKRGEILNVASVAAFVPGPGMAVYYASKAFVLSFSEGLAHELRHQNVRVCVLCPGPVHTEFQARAGFSAALPKIYHNLTSFDVASQAVRGLRSGRLLVIPGFVNRQAVRLVRFLPRQWSARLVGRLQSGRLKG